MAAPTFEGGFFTQEAQERSSTKIGEIALITSINPDDIDKLALRQSIIDEYYIEDRSDKDGSIKFRAGCLVNVIDGSKAGDFLSDEEIIELSRDGTALVTEHRPGGA